MAVRPNKQPSPISGLLISSITGSTIVLAWSAAKGASTYQPQYRIRGSQTWLNWSTQISGLTVTVGANPPGPPLASGTPYDLQVVSINHFGTATSNLVSGTTLGAINITSVSLDNMSFIAGSAVNTPVGNITVTMTTGSFSGTLTLSGADAASFKIVSGQLQLAVGNTTAKAYNINIIATQSGVGNSPFTQNFSNIVGTSAQSETTNNTTVSAPGTIIYASQTMGVVSSGGPWNRFALVNSGSPYQVSLNESVSYGQYPTAFVTAIVYHNHTLFQHAVNGSVSDDWWYYNTNISDYTEFSVTAVTPSTVNYTLNLSAGTTVATLAVTMSDGSTFAGALSVGGTDAASFSITGTTLQVATGHTLSNTAYTITLTATPTTVGNAFTTSPITFHSGALAQVPIGGYVFVDQSAAGSIYYPSWISHWNGFISAMGGRTPYLTGTGWADQANPYVADTSPSVWPTFNQLLANNFASVVGTSTIPMITWPFSYNNGTPVNLYYPTNQIANGSLDSYITTSLNYWKTAGFTKLYLRPAWEFNLNNGFSDFAVNATNCANFIVAFRHFYTVVHTWAASNAMTVLVCWNPSVFNNSNDLSPSLTVAQQFPNQTTGDNFVDIVALDFYSEASAYATDTSTSATAFTVPGMVALAQKWNLPIAFCECGGLTFDASGVSAATTWIPNLLSFLRGLAAQGTPIEFISLWDNNVGAVPPDQGADGMAFSHSSDNQAQIIAAWRAGLGTGASNPVMTLPSPY